MKIINSIFDKVLFQSSFFNFTIILLIALMLPSTGTSQDNSFELSYDVHRNHPSIRMTTDKLQQAETLKDLNKNFRRSWIKEYKRVEIQTYHQGKIRKVRSKDHNLNEQQKQDMLNADPGSTIAVNIEYLPDNNLKHNDIKEINFSFTVDPQTGAQFPGGQEDLKQYLKENAMDKIEEADFKMYQMSAVSFTIDEDGLVSNPHLSWSSEDENTDAVLLEAICNMPNWKPATYNNGLNVKQEFVFTVGDMRSCVVNMYNIKDLPSEVD